MSEAHFFQRQPALALSAVLELTGAEMKGDAAPDLVIENVAPLESASYGDLAFLDNPAYLQFLESTKASAVLVSPKFVGRVAAHISTPLLVVREPYRAFALVAAALYPAAQSLTSAFSASHCNPTLAHVHPTAKLEQGVVIDPGVVIGENAEIGAGTVIAANAVIGANCRIGRQCAIGAGATVSHALIGNRVIIHQGVRIGQDGFGFAMGAKHLKVPQIGRVIVQDDVEIGAGSCIDRGATRDTIIGEGSKIDNLVQIGHNVVIGRHCIVVSQVGISGSTTLEDYVVLGGQVGVVGHVRIGAGAQIAGASSVREDIPAGARWGGYPAKPIRDWFRELTTLKKIAAKQKDNAEQNDKGDAP